MKILLKGGEKSEFPEIFIDLDEVESDCEEIDSTSNTAGNDHRYYKSREYNLCIFLINFQYIIIIYNCWMIFSSNINKYFFSKVTIISIVCQKI